MIIIKIMKPLSHDLILRLNKRSKYYTIKFTKTLNRI